jgi:hypothetical protein
MTSDDDLDVLGFKLLLGVLDDTQRHELLTCLPATAPEDDRRKAGLRLDLPAISGLVAFVRSSSVRRLVEPVLGSGVFVVRALLFDKVAEANWKVPWHRDRTIAVRRRVDAAGYGPWSTKEGIPHVEPPRNVLDGMLVLRLHMDDCDADNGPLRVISGSHRDADLACGDLGRVPTVCGAPAGSALLLRPLLLHASSPALSPRHRRVLHLEFAVTELPGGLEWRERG